MIEADGLARRYGEFTAVEGISFSVADGEILGMLGPNGAGKTTTIRMITGFLPPSTGRVTINGYDLVREPNQARREVGYLPENVALYPEMRVSEYLAYRARLQGMSRPDARTAIGETIDRCLLQEAESQIIGTLSKGYRQRVGLASAILHSPRVLILDEPTVGLDPKQIIAIRELIREFGRERTLLLSTHILPEVEQLCARVLIIDQGRIIAEGTPAELRAQSKGRSALNVRIKDPDPSSREVLEQISGVLDISLDSDGPEPRFRIESEAGVDLREPVFRAAVENGWILLELAEKKVSLEDVFVRLTTTDNKHPETTQSNELSKEQSDEKSPTPAATATPEEGS